MKVISDYIASTRIGHIDGLGEGAHDRINTINQLFGDGRHYDLELITVVVRTLSKQCELVNLDSKRFLIFDLQVCNSFHMLTVLLYWGIPQAIHAYFGKMLVEEAAGIGHLNLAAIGNAIMAAQTFYKPRHEAYLDTRLDRFGMQEFFIYCHEHTHVFLNSNLPISSEMKELGVSLTKDNRTEDWLDQMKMKYPEACPDQATMENIKLRADEQQAFIFDNSRDLADEFMCDNFALLLLVQWCGSNNVSIKEAYYAARLCLRNLKPLNSMRAFVRQIRDGIDANGIDRKVRLIDARLMRLPNLFEMQARQIDKTFDSQSFFREASELENRFSKLLEMPLKASFFPATAAKVASMTGCGTSPTCASLTQCFQIVERCGWQPSAREPAYLLVQPGAPDK